VRPAIGPGTGLRPGGVLGKQIAPIVVLVTGVTLGPGPIRLVDSGQLVKFHPKIGVADGMILLPPMAAFPSDHPQRNALPDVLGIRRDLHFTGLFERDEAWIAAISSIRLLVV